MRRSSVSFVIPMFNEEETIEHAIANSGMLVHQTAEDRRRHGSDERIFESIDVG